MTIEQIVEKLKPQITTKDGVKGLGWNGYTTPEDVAFVKENKPAIMEYIEEREAVLKIRENAARPKHS